MSMWIHLPSHSRFEGMQKILMAAWSKIGSSFCLFRIVCEQLLGLAWGTREKELRALALHRLPAASQGQCSQGLQPSLLAQAWKSWQRR